METLKIIGDCSAVGIVGLWIIGIMPHIATGLTIVWMGLRIYESETVQKYLNKKKKKR